MPFSPPSFFSQPLETACPLPVTDLALDATRPSPSLSTHFQVTLCFQGPSVIQIVSALQCFSRPNNFPLHGSLLLDTEEGAYRPHLEDPPSLQQIPA